MHVVTLLRVLLGALPACTALGIASPARACPNCAVGRQARSEVWNQDFGENLTVALLPFAIVGALCVRIEAESRRPPSPAQRAREPMRDRGEGECSSGEDER